MVKARGGYLAGLALAALAAGWLWYSGRSPSTTVTAVPTGRGQRSRAGEIPRIDLARLAGPRPQAQVGRRDLFSFGAARVEAGSAAPPPPTVAVAPPSPVFTGPPPPPPMNLKYIGNLESKQGLKVAVLMTDRKEVLTGQVGELVANRFRIVKIGLESVDIQEVPDGRVRRIPLRGN